MSKRNQVTQVQVDTALWATSLLPEGVLEKWLKRDGEFVGIGQPLAVVRVEGALHDIATPANGRLVIDRRPNSIIEPGAVIGHIEDKNS